MVKINLINMKQDKSKSKSYLIYKPSKTNLDEYQIIFTSNSTEFIQFVLFVKFANKIKLFQPETISKTKSFGDIDDTEKNFPYNGIIYSCKLTSSNPLIVHVNPLDLCTNIIIKNIIKTPLNPIKNTLNPIQWDKIFVINLERRSDRKKQMEDFFNNNNISSSQYEFIRAYDGHNPKIISKYVEKKKSIPNYPIITSGHFACLLSHLEAIKLAKSRGYKQVMILEDDVNTKEQDLVSKLNSILVPDYDLLYLGGIMSKKKYFTSNWVWSGETHIMGAYAYILSSTIFDIIISKLDNLDEYIDFFYLKEIQPNYKTIILEDIIKTDLTSSDTSHKSRTLIKRLDYIK